MSRGDRNEHDGMNDKQCAFPGMTYAKNINKSYFRVLDRSEARNCPYKGNGKRN